MPGAKRELGLRAEYRKVDNAGRNGAINFFLPLLEKYHKTFPLPERIFYFF